MASPQPDFAGRTGFIREALQYEIPIVPAVTHGVQDGMIVLYRGERLAKAEEHKHREFQFWAEQAVSL